SVQQSAGSSARNERPPRPPGEKVSKDGTEYIDYQTLELGVNAAKGFTTRYWDACKPHCSWPRNIADINPFAICRNCDRNGREMPALYEHPDSDPNSWGGMYLGTPNACDDKSNPAQKALWQRSPAYNNWVANNPAYPSNSSAYMCNDMIPHIVNDTLAYAFAATQNDGVQRCGKCYQIQFDGGEWKNESDGLAARPNNRALKGKTLIVMSNNTGGLDDTTQFDIMIPGGGVGQHDAFSEQIGVSKGELGIGFGGLLGECVDVDLPKLGIDYYKASMEWFQNCVREKCIRLFSNKQKQFLDGCLFQVDWLMAAMNPTMIYREVECPKYLADKYRSNIHTEKPQYFDTWQK
ncbi:MAG: hypothetical protein FWB90_05145, partial [Fibromonadales bacterium]|nr:hypothetical protein [Fibromonadales bacterium]